MNKITILGRFGIRVLVLGAFVTPGIASAQVLRCDSRVLQPDDEQRLIGKAKEGLPRGLEPIVAHPCRNPGSAHAEIITEHLKANGGVIRWWEMQCQRDADGWKCDPAEFKQFINARVVVDGRPRHVALSFDKNTTLTRARIYPSKHCEFTQTLPRGCPTALRETTIGSTCDKAFPCLGRGNRYKSP